MSHKQVSLMDLLLNASQSLEQAGVGARGQSVFVLHMPDTVKEGVLLRNSLNPIPIDHELPGYRNSGRFMVVCRSTSYAGVFELVERAMAALTISDTFTAGMKINHQRPQAEPLVYPASESGSYEAVVNFDVNYAMI